MELRNSDISNFIEIKPSEDAFEKLKTQGDETPGNSDLILDNQANSSYSQFVNLIEKHKKSRSTEKARVGDGKAQNDESPFSRVRVN